MIKQYLLILLLLTSVVFLSGIYPRRVVGILWELLCFIDRPFLLARDSARTILVGSWRVYTQVIQQAGVDNNHTAQQIVGSVFSGASALIAVFAELELMRLTIGPVLGVRSDSSVNTVLISPVWTMAIALVASIVFFGIQVLDLHGLTHWGGFEKIAGSRRRWLLYLNYGMTLVLLATIFSLALWRWIAVTPGVQEDTLASTQSHALLMVFCGIALVTFSVGILGLPSFATVLLLVGPGSLLLLIGLLVGPFYLISHLVGQALVLTYNIVFRICNLIAAALSSVRGRLGGEDPLTDLPDPPQTAPEQPQPSSQQNGPQQSDPQPPMDDTLDHDAEDEQPRVRFPPIWDPYP